MRTTERRFSADRPSIERRSVADGVTVPVLIGHASVFDERTTLYDSPNYLWTETVRAGAFAAAIAEGQDVRSLFNHDANFVLGRTASGTLRLSEDARGLATETELLDSQTVRDLVIGPVSRGDISGMSFAFLPRNGNDPGIVVERPDGSVTLTLPGERITFSRDASGRVHEDRELTSVDLVDISPVTYPAYAGTSVSVRGIPGGAIEGRADRAAEILRSAGSRRSRRLAMAESRIRLAGG